MSARVDLPPIASRHDAMSGQSEPVDKAWDAHIYIGARPFAREAVEAVYVIKKGGQIIKTKCVSGDAKGGADVYLTAILLGLRAARPCQRAFVHLRDRGIVLDMTRHIPLWMARGWKDVATPHAHLYQRIHRETGDSWVSWEWDKSPGREVRRALKAAFRHSHCA